MTFSVCQDCVHVEVKDVGPVVKKLEDIRLMESRKSARLVNTDTDFSLLADFNIVEQRKLAQESSGQPQVSSRRRLHSMSDFLDRKRQKNGEKERREAKRRQRSERQSFLSGSSSGSIEVPLSLSTITGSRKRRTSESRAEIDSGYGSSFGSGFFKTGEENLKECTAAMVLMNLSVSPRDKWTDPASYFTSSSSETSPPTTPRPSPAPSLSHLALSEDEEPYKRSRPSPRSCLYQCTWRGCSHTETCQTEMERHVRRHLALPDPPPGMDYAGEEDFYYTELEVEEMTDTSMDILTEIDSGCSSASNDGLEYCYKPSSAVPEKPRPAGDNFIKILPNTTTQSPAGLASSSSSSLPAHLEFGLSHPLGDHIGMVRPSYEAPTTIYVVNTVPSPSKDHQYNTTNAALHQSWQGKKLVSIVPRPSDNKPTDLLHSDQSPVLFKSSPSGMKSDKKCRKVNKQLSDIA